MAAVFLQGVSSGWAEIPLGTILTLLVIAAGIAAILLKERMRKPVTFVTSDEREADKAAMAAAREADQKALATALQGLRDDFKRVSQEVREWESEFRSTCATNEDLTRLGTKVDTYEKFILGIQDNAIKAMEQSGQAMGEVAHLRANMQRVENSVDELHNKIGPLPEMIGRLDENVKRLLRREGGQG